MTSRSKLGVLLGVAALITALARVHRETESWGIGAFVGLWIGSYFVIAMLGIAIAVFFSSLLVHVSGRSKHASGIERDARIDEAVAITAITIALLHLGQLVGFNLLG